MGPTKAIYPGTFSGRQLSRLTTNASPKQISSTDMPPELDHEEDYVSEEDSDFAPEDGVEQDLSASEDDVPDAAKPKPKRQAGDRAAEDAGFDNSGDEGIIEKGKKRQKKAKAKDRTAGEDEGGEGGLVKTRSMRAAEYA